MSDSVPVEFNAVVLSGGRSSRLGGIPKAQLLLNGRSLLDLTCEAAGAAQRIVVVGPVSGPELKPAEAHPGGTPATGHAGREYVRESPPFGGPAAALAAAVEHLTGAASACTVEEIPQWLLVLACDMPRVELAIPALLTAAAERPDGSVLAHDGGRDQPLAALYRLDSLRLAVADVNGTGGARNLSMKALLARLQWRTTDVPHGSTADVDTWADAQSLGVSGTAPTIPQEQR